MGVVVEQVVLLRTIVLLIVVREVVMLLFHQLNLMLVVDLVMVVTDQEIPSIPHYQISPITILV